jgi:protein SCO1/2
MRMIRYSAWAAVAALVLAAGILYAVNGNSQNGGGSAAIGGPFTLTTQDGKRLSSDELKGKPFAVFFGFTYCPEICPTTLYELTQTIEALGDTADKMRYLFITVDPERDTPEQMKTYLSSFDKRIIGLTGTPEDIKAAADAYRVFYEKVKTDDSYTMNHTALVYLMDADGKFKDVLATGVPPETRLQKLKSLAGATS